MNIEELGLDIWDGSPVEGNPSWAGEFGSNGYYFQVKDGITYIYSLDGTIVLTYP